MASACFHEAGSTASDQVSDERGFLLAVGIARHGKEYTQKRKERKRDCMHVEINLVFIYCY